MWWLSKSLHLTVHLRAIGHEPWRLTSPYQNSWIENFSYFARFSWMNVLMGKTILLSFQINRAEGDLFLNDRQFEMTWINVNPLYLYLFFATLPAACICTAVEQLVYTFTNQVGAGNFSYFKLHREGVVRLELKTTSGDADLYVSSSTLSPDFRNYELSSATCGYDEVTVPAEMQRPVGVGVFGHPSHEVSQFVLSVYFSYDDADLESVALDGDSSHRSTASSTQSQLDAEQPESLLWSIFVGLLKIILDILANV